MRHFEGKRRDPEMVADARRFRTGSPSRALKVAFVLGQIGTGGTEAQAQLLVRSLLAAGLRVHVYVLEVPCEGQHYDFGGAATTFLGASRTRSLTGAFNNIAAAVRLAVGLRRQRVDVVHAAMARAYILAPLVCPVFRRPRIVAWRRNMGDHLKGSFFGDVAEYVAARACDVVIANSQAVADYWCTRARVSPKSMVIIHNALEDWRFERKVAMISMQAGPPTVLAVGGLRPVKGHKVLLDAIKIVQSRHVVLGTVILGDGEDRAALRQHAESLSVDLLLPGHVQDPRAWLAAATVYVQSSNSEGASNALAEAMAQGCAIVATDVGGTAEMLGEAGVLVPARNSEALAEALVELIENPKRRLMLGTLAANRAKGLFSAQAFVDAHYKVYQGG